MEIWVIYIETKSEVKYSQLFYPVHCKHLVAVKFPFSGLCQSHMNKIEPLCSVVGERHVQ